MSILTRSRFTGETKYRESFFRRSLILQIQIVEEQADSREVLKIKAPPGHPDPEAFRRRQEEKVANAWTEVRRYWRDATANDL